MSEPANEPGASATLKTNRRIVFIDYLRIYACLGVLECHLFKSFNSIELPQNFWFYRLFAFLYHALMRSVMEGGVVAFFLISGYIIAYVIERESAAVFLVRRVFRIYPAYIAAILAQYYCVDHLIPNWGALLPRFTLLGDFLGTPQVLNGVDWTLRIEVIFYGFIALLSFARLASNPFLIKILVLPLAALGVIFMPPFPPTPLGVFNQFFPFLLLGMSFYYTEQKKTSFLYILLIGALTFYAFIKGYTAGQLPAAGYLAPVMIFAAAWVCRDKIRGGRLVGFAARATYTVYLFHNWYIVYATGLLRARGVGEAGSESLAVLSLFLLCYLVHFTVEQPCIDLGRLLTQRMKRKNRILAS